jgi:hypothetical protein
MGKTKRPCKAEYPKGTKVQIVDCAFLEDFARHGKFHHKLEPEQLGFADKIADVKSVGVYHRGGELYELVGAPGLWHEACLVPWHTLKKTVQQATFSLRTGIAGFEYREQDFKGAVYRKLLRVGRHALQLADRDQ